MTRRVPEPRSEFTMTATIWIPLAMALAIAAWVVATYNGLVARRQRSNQAFADVDVQRRLRHDRVPNLVEVVRAYAGHEREALEAVILARSAAIGQPQGTQGQSAAELSLGRALGRLVALAESYPDLKANRNFLHLSEELSDIENKLAAARRFFNNAVAEYNAAVESFPAILVAARLGFVPRAFFELDEPTRGRLSVPPPVRL